MNALIIKGHNHMLSRIVQNVLIKWDQHTGTKHSLETLGTAWDIHLPRFIDDVSLCFIEAPF